MNFFLCQHCLLMQLFSFAAVYTEDVFVESSCLLSQAPLGFVSQATLPWHIYSMYHSTQWRTKNLHQKAYFGRRSAIALPCSAVLKPLAGLGSRIDQLWLAVMLPGCLHYPGRSMILVWDTQHHSFTLLLFHFE